MPTLTNLPNDAVEEDSKLLPLQSNVKDDDAAQNTVTLTIDLPKSSTSVSQPAKAYELTNVIAAVEFAPGTYWACSREGLLMLFGTVLIVIGSCLLLRSLFVIVFMAEMVVGGTMLFFGVCAYFWTAACAAPVTQLQQAQPIRVLQEHLQSILKSPPQITWSMQCYHEDDAQLTVTYTAANHPQVAKNKIITWSGTQSFAFKSWQDVSHPVQLARLGSFQALTFHKSFVFADEATRAAFTAQKEAFINANKHRDKLFTVEETFEVAGFKETMLADAGGCSGSLCVYVMMALLLLAYPWSCLVKSGERRVDYRLVKMLSTTHDRIKIAPVIIPVIEEYVGETEDY
ncbi:uncharacterized protein LOC129602492 [Paramacrobiotus metropolitanus]|uniref:uncharacterized protein LOC129602492 n=1 Tax=Paramacrobiotus metropolitanus TaxID=2943436 RepID=UPI0024458199|nr:uncharacterized protein LOC129602492 [Paramacrobiotus metropolitanus]